MGLVLILVHIAFGVCPFWFVAIGIAIGCALGVEFLQLYGYKNGHSLTWLEALPEYWEIRGHDTLMDLLCLLIMLFEYAVYMVIKYYILLGQNGQ